MTHYIVNATGQTEAEDPVQAAQWFAESAAHGQPFSFLEVKDVEQGGRFVIDMEEGKWHPAGDIANLVGDVAIAMPPPTMNGIEIPERIAANLVLDALGGLDNHAIEQHHLWSCIAHMTREDMVKPVVMGKMVVIGEEHLGELWANGQMVHEDDFGYEAFVPTDLRSAVIADAQIASGGCSLLIGMDLRQFSDDTEHADYVAHNAYKAQDALQALQRESERQLRIYAGENPAVILAPAQVDLLMVIADAYFEDSDPELNAADRIDLALCMTEVEVQTDLAVAVRQSLEFGRNGQGASNGRG